MKRKFSLTALILAAALLCGMLAGCGSSDTNIDVSTGTFEGTQNNGSQETQANIMGKVTYVATSYISVTVYTTDTEVEDYALLDIASLTESEEMESISTDSDTGYYRADGGTLTAAARDDIKTGVMIVSTTSEEGEHQMIILEGNS